MLIKASDFISFLQRCGNERIGEYDEIIVPVMSSDEDTLNWKKLDNNLTFSLESSRTVDPLKILYYLFRDSVTDKKYKKSKRLVAGVKACDINALVLLDKAMINEEFVDPSYKYWRETTTVISVDCTTIKDSCHCDLIGGLPYPSRGFDLNLSRIDEYYYITAGSEKGDVLLTLIKQYCSVEAPSDDAVNKINGFRNQIASELRYQNQKYNSRENLRTLKYPAIENWQNNSKDCVGCGACTNICPSCYCLILNDESKAEKFVKVRSYDSCQLHGYARVAGGGNPRPKISQRFRNRYLCKFCYMMDNFEMLGCTGCGRCIDACPAEIDFREVVDKLVNHVDSVISEPPKIKTQTLGRL